MARCSKCTIAAAPSTGANRLRIGNIPAAVIRAPWNTTAVRWLRYSRNAVARSIRIIATGTNSPRPTAQDATSQPIANPVT